MEAVIVKKITLPLELTASILNFNSCSEAIYIF